jgi:hypothetical protein
VKLSNSFGRDMRENPIVNNAGVATKVKMKMGSLLRTLSLKFLLKEKNKTRSISN